MAEKEPTEDVATNGFDRYSEVTGHGQVPFRHPVIWRVLAVSRVFFYIIDPHCALAAECRPENGRISRHRKVFEFLDRHTGQRIQHVRFTVRVLDIVEERTELGS